MSNKSELVACDSIDSESMDLNNEEVRKRLTNDQAGDMKCGCRVSEIDDFVNLLTPAAKAIYDFRVTFKEYLKIKVLDKEDFKVEEYKRLLLCQSFFKPFYLENNLVPKWVVKKTAAVFNKLVAEHKLDYGVLGPARVMLPYHEVTKVPNSNYINKDDVRGIGLMIFYSFPSKELMEWADKRLSAKYDNFEIIREQLNKTLGSECFVKKGTVGDINWDSLPDLEQEENKNNWEIMSELPPEMLGEDNE
jgi:hypothetical protein